MQTDDYQAIAVVAELPDRVLTRVRVGRVELVVVRFDHALSVLHGLCPHQGTPMMTGSITGTTLQCSSHQWCFDAHTGTRVDRPGPCLHRFAARVRDGNVEVDVRELERFADHAQDSAPPTAGRPQSQ